MYNPWLVILGGLFLLTSIATSLASPQKRSQVLGRLHIRDLRATGSLTPPRSSSRKKQRPPTDEASFRDIFPPHRRQVSTQCNLRGSGPGAYELAASPPNYRDILSDKLDTRDSKLEHSYTATGFTVKEIERLGDFPDYAALSGVPLPEPYPEFDISRARPRPYRPFRWAYHQTMSLAKMEPDWWLELEHTYASRIAQRQKLFRKYGSMVLHALPGSEIATKELMEMCLQFLCARYPQYFRLDLENMIFSNTILHPQSNVKEEEPLHILLNNIPEDFACMLRQPETGLYTFRAGVTAVHWAGTPIPDYKEKMQFSMDRYFAKKPTNKPMQRGSWGLEVDQPLFMPPGDPHERLRHEQNPEHTLERCNFRVDWQTLRRLPLSGSTVFNFKALFTPVTQFRDEPYIPSLLAKVLKEGKKDLMEYKSTWHTEHIVIPAMEQYGREQIEQGIVPSEFEVHTLDEAPFFPGWEEKWHRQQGF